MSLKAEKKKCTQFAPVSQCKLAPAHIWTKKDVTGEQIQKNTLDMAARYERAEFYIIFSSYFKEN